MEEIIFASGSVPVAVAARVYGKDASWIRAGIVSGWLPIGKATRSGKLVTNLEEMNSKYGRINFYISPKLLWQETGYIWRGERETPLLRIEAFLLAIPVVASCVQFVDRLSGFMASISAALQNECC